MTTHTSGAADLPEARLFTKKPVTISATQWFKNGDHPQVRAVAPSDDLFFTGMGGATLTDREKYGVIGTLESPNHLVTPGDWIITGVAGEHYACKPDIFEATYSPAALAAGQAVAPIDMVLHCPACGEQHIDAPEPARFGPLDDGDLYQVAAAWSNPPHRSHFCHGCGHIWRPADVATNGVQAITTTGKDDSPIVATRPAPPAMDGGEDAERWEFRWLNPANQQNVAPSELAWKTVNSKGMRSEKEVLEDLKTYRYQGKLVYELRPLFATRALQKPEIRCPVRLANGGDCPRHNLQCGWPDCNKETK